nr:hypothetical protein MACL_00002903 [Theileria orientalis]
MGETPSNAILDVSTDRQNIFKDGQLSDGMDSTLLSDSATFSHPPNTDFPNTCLNGDINFSLNNEEEFINLIHSQSFEDYVRSTDSTLLRRYSCPCFHTDFNLNGFNFPEDLNTCGPALSSERAPNGRNMTRCRRTEPMKCCNHLRNNTWGSLIYRFRKFCLESNKNCLTKPLALVTDPNTSLRNTDLHSKPVDKPLKRFDGDSIQYAVFKPINLSINKTNSLNGFVASKEEKEDVVFVVKSSTGHPITKYGLTRIISCTKRQEYEVVDHNTGDYYLLKLTNDVNIFNIYETVFDQPHPNLVEVTQLLTNVDSSYSESPRPKQKNGQIYYILLNSFKHMALSDYHINTLPSLINFKVLKMIVKGLLKALVYLHSRSLALTKLTMKSVIICRSHEDEFCNGDDVVAKIVDLDDAKLSRSPKEYQNDIRLVGNLLYAFIEGRHLQSNHVFKSSLWTASPQMFDFCITALAKLTAFNSATEALIHPWITSLD